MDTLRLYQERTIIANEPDAPAQAFAWLASIRERNGQSAEAIEYYRRALALDYGQVRWRFSLAALLAGTGQVTEARKEAEACLRFQPAFTAARKLIDQLSLDHQVAQKEQQIP